MIEEEEEESGGRQTIHLRTNEARGALTLHTHRETNAKCSISEVHARPGRLLPRLNSSSSSAHSIISKHVEHCLCSCAAAAGGGCGSSGPHGRKWNLHNYMQHAICKSPPLMPYTQRGLYVTGLLTGAAAAAVVGAVFFLRLVAATAPRNKLGSSVCTSIFESSDRFARLVSRSVVLSSQGRVSLVPYTDQCYVYVVYLG